MGGQRLLLQAADRQHPALQRDLAGHPDDAAHRAPGQQADQGGRHGDARRRPVLRHRSRRHVQVEGPVLERQRGDPEFRRVAPHVGEGDLRRLLHDVAKLAGEGQAGV